ncbi:PTS sugar transporter subunit IIA [Virgibacillus sp. L01]|uniref:PTS sugar transporter subunit IIA n=1 Tax=Virgibacillus sp. L01 TaxID=3457429 RepID=UPI003FD4A809
MLKKIFGKKEEQHSVTLHATVSGGTVLLEDVPDPVFSQKMMGNGIAIFPQTSTVISPVDGKIMQLFPTNHAVGIQAVNGAEILIHIGLETVSLNGEGFTPHIQEGDHVKQGDKLISFDKTVIEEKAKSTIIPVVITNTDSMREINYTKQSKVTAGEDEILTVVK